MNTFIKSVCISIISIIYLRESIALKPALVLRKMNGKMEAESVYIEFFECSSQNNTISNNQDAYEVKQLKQDQKDKRNSTDGPKDIMKSEIMKLKQDLADVIIEQIKLKDLVIQSLLEKNNILQLLNGASEDYSIRPATSAESNESMISCF